MLMLWFRHLLVKLTQIFTNAAKILTGSDQPIMNNACNNDKSCFVLHCICFLYGCRYFAFFVHKFFFVILYFVKHSIFDQFFYQITILGLILFFILIYFIH